MMKIELWFLSKTFLIIKNFSYLCAMEEYKGNKIKNTTYEKSRNGYIVSIDENNFKHLIEIGKMVEKGNAKSLGLYIMGMMFYSSNEKLSI